jgi:urease accessory protein
MIGFIGALLHPLALPAHALALLGVGLFIGQQRGRLVALAAFAAGLAAGLSAIALGAGPTAAADVLLALTALTGLLLALARSMPTLVTAPLAVGVGIALGLDSPPEVTSVAAATVMLVGTGLGACLALAIVVAVSGYLTAGWQRIGVRIVGSWIAASALLVLALRFARGQLFDS